MSTALANFSGSNFLTDFQAVNLLYKKYLGLPNAYPTAGAAQDVTTISSRPKVFANLQVFSQAVPSAAPNDLVVDASWNDVNSSLGGSFKPTRSYSSANPYIVKYENMPLKAVQNNVSFEGELTGLKDASGTLYSSYTVKPRFLSQVIPGNFDPAGSYAVTVKNINNAGASIAQFNNQYPWILDADAGFLTFYGSQVSGQPPLQFYNVSPTISFWRYEGTVGIGSTTVPAPSGANITVEDPSNGRFVITKDASGNLKALSDITYSNGVLDISGLLSIKNLTLDVSGSAEYKLTFPSTLPPVSELGAFSYLASDASGNMIWRNNVTEAAAYIHPEGGFFLRDANGDLIINSDGSMQVDEGLQRIDNWLYNYIVSAPPQIIDISNTANTTTYVEFSWSYPIQLNVGIADQYLPRIDSLTVQYKTSTGGAFSTILDKVTSVITPKITKLRLYNTSGTDGIVGNTYYKYNINTLNSLVENTLSIWYDNKNLTPIKANLDFTGYKTAAPPTAPTFNSVSTTSPSSALNLAVNITSPTAADQFDASNPSVSIKEYQIDISGGGATTTYIYTPTGGSGPTIPGTTFTITLTDNSTSVTGSTGTLSPALNIDPLISYEITIRAINTSTNTPSANSDTKPITSGIVSASAYTLPALALPSSNYNNASSYKVYNDNTILSNKIYRNGLGSRSADAISNIPIHVTSNAASQASNIMKLETFIKEGAGADISGGALSFNGFPLGSAQDASLNDVRIQTTGENTDPSNPTLYKRVTSTTVSITNTDTTNNIAMKASNQLKTVSLKYSTDISNGVVNGSTTTETDIYRVDDIAVAPLAKNGVIKLAGTITSSTHRSITGLKVLDTSTAKSVLISCDISNVANYYVANPYIAYSSEGSNNRPILATSTDGDVTRLTGGTITDGRFSEVWAYASPSIGLVISNNTFSNGDMYASLTPRNIVTAAGSGANTSPLYTLIDHASILFLNDTSVYRTSIPTMNTTVYTPGCHMAFSGFTDGKLNYQPSTSVYDHTASWGQYDMLITQGAFKAAGSAAYLNHSGTRDGDGTASSGNANANLSSVTTDHNWAIFAWNIPSTSNGYNSINYQYVSNSTAPAKVYYSVLDGSSTPGDGNKGIYWMDPTLPPAGIGFPPFAQNSANNMSTVSGGKFTDTNFALNPATGSNSASCKLFMAIQLPPGATIKSVQVQAVSA